MPGGLATRTLVTLLIGAVALLGLGPVVSGYAVEGFWDAVALAALGAVLNAVLWPALTDHAGLVYGGVVVALLILLAAGLLPAATQPWAIALYALLGGLGVWALRRQVVHEAAAPAEAT